MSEQTISEQTPDSLRAAIREQVAEYHAVAFPKAPFVPGVTPVPVSGKVFDAEDMQSLMEATLDFWLTTGRFGTLFEREFARTVEFVSRCLSIPDRLPICSP